MLHKLEFFYNDTATTEIYTLSLHDALPICTFGPYRLTPTFCTPYCFRSAERSALSSEYDLKSELEQPAASARQQSRAAADRKSTRLNSSHANISHAVFCLKKHNASNTLVTV